MTTIKSYTDLDQSRKLAKILPLESANMWWSRCTITDFGDGILKVSYAVEPCNISQFKNTREDVPCWSLAALLEVLPKKYYPVKDHKTDLILGKPKDKWCVLYWDTTGMQHGEETLADNPVDACVEMILKLHQMDLL